MQKSRKLPSYLLTWRHLFTLFPVLFAVSAPSRRMNFDFANPRENLSFFLRVGLILWHQNSRPLSFFIKIPKEHRTNNISNIARFDLAKTWHSCSLGHLDQCLNRSHWPKSIRLTSRGHWPYYRVLNLAQCDLAKTWHSCSLGHPDQFFNGLH